MQGLSRGQSLNPATGLSLATLLHIGLLWAAGWITPAEPQPQIELIEFEVAQLPGVVPEVVPEPPPELPEPEVVPPPEPEPPKPKLEPKTPPPRPEATIPPETTSADPPPKPAPIPIKLPKSAVVPSSNSGVNVHVGAHAQPGSVGGSPNGSATGRPGGRDGGSPDGTGAADAWAPKSDLYISRLPEVVRVPELECPAVVAEEVDGIVVLEVDVRRDGSLRAVKIKSGIGHGCDEIARKALRQAKFRPALATDGQPADYKLFYEYEFQLGGR